MIYYHFCCIWIFAYSPTGNDFNSHNGNYNQIPSPSLTSHQHQGLSMGESANHSSMSTTNSSDILKVSQPFSSNNNHTTPLLSPPPPPPSALSTLLQHPQPTPMFPPGNGSTSAMHINNHHQASPISVSTSMHDIMMHTVK